MLQCQAEAPGAPSAEDLRSPSQIQPPEERAGAGQTAPPAGARHVEPRVSVELSLKTNCNLLLLISEKSSRHLDLVSSISLWLPHFSLLSINVSLSVPATTMSNNNRNESTGHQQIYTVRSKV